MADAVTKVIYDIAGAIAKLDQLDKRVKQSGKEAKDAFKDGDKGLKGFSGSLGKVTGKAFKMAKSFGTVAAGAGAIVFAVAKVAQSLENTEAKINGIIETGNKVLELRNRVSASEDAGELRNLEEQNRGIELLDAASKEKENRLTIIRDGIAEEIALEREKIKKIQGLRRDATKDRESAEKRLQDKLNELAGDDNQFGNRPKGRQIGDLTAKARQEAQKGNVDGAEALIDRAKKLSAELGNHVFFTNQIDQAQSEVVRALEKDVKEAKKKESALAGEEKQLSKNLTVADKVLKSFEKQLRTVTLTNRELSRQKQLIQDTTKQTVDAQKAEEAQRTVDTSFENAQKVSGAIGDQGFFGGFFDNAKRLFDGIRSPGTLGTVDDTNNAIQAELSNLAALLTEINADGERTPAEIEKLGKFLTDATNRAGQLQTGIDTGTLNASPQTDLNRLTTVLEQLSTSLTASELARSAGVQGSEGIGQGARRVREQQQETLSQRQTIQEITQNVNIQATTTQGKFDAEAVRQIQEIVRTENRKGT